MLIEKVMLEQIKQEIKMFESDRVKNDILNIKRYAPLYEIYYRLQSKIKNNN